MNPDRWKHLADLHTSPGPMDWRHVLMVNAVLESERPKTVVEIGCFKGFSTAAIIEAHEKHTFEQVDLVDINPTPSLREMAQLPGFRLIADSSANYKGTPECWIIDGDHYDGALVDYRNAHAAKARIIMIHDSNAMRHPKLQMNGGAAMIGVLCQRDSKVVFEDNLDRDGELTHRGLLIGFTYTPQPGTLDWLKKLQS